MGLFNIIFLTAEERARAADMAVDTRRVYGVGAQDRLLQRAREQTARRERRIIKRAADDVYLHYAQYEQH